MKSIKTVFLSGMLTLGVFSIVAYSSCEKKDKDKCESMICENGGTCVDGSCQCPEGYEGVHCETVSSHKFTGTYAATDECPLGNRTGDDLKYNVTIIADNTDPLEVSIIGIANTANNFIFEGTAHGDSLIIADQIMPDSLSYSGTIIYVDASTLKMTFNIRDNGAPVEACNSLLKK